MVNHALNANKIIGISAESGGQPYETAVPIEADESSMTLLSEEASTLKKQKTFYPFSFLTQRRVIMKRNLQTLILDKTLLVLHRVVFVVLGLFVGGFNFAVQMDLAGFQNSAG